MTRRDDILDAALALAFEGGPNRVTTVAIAQRLGLTQPALYRHFRSKADLWAAITERLGAEVSANIAAAEAADSPAIERLKALVLGHLAIIQRTPALPEIMVTRDPNSADALVRTAMQARMGEFQHALSRLCAEAHADESLKPDADPQDVATLIMGVLQSLALRLLFSRDATTLVDEGARLFSLQLSAFQRGCEE